MALAAGVCVCALSLSSACGRGQTVEAPIVVVVGTLEPSRTDAGGLGVSSPLAAGAVPRPSNGEFLGRWEGTGVQSDGLSWPMNVDFATTGVGPCARVEYPSIPCSAEWICTRFDGELLEAREELVADSARRCVDLGTMKMRLLPGDAMEWQWDSPGLTASATLRRR